MVMILGDDRQKLIDSLGLPDAVVKLTRGEAVHEELSPWCRGLSYSLEREDFSPPGIDVVPLWEGESSITGFFIDGTGRPSFIRYDVEYLSEYEILGDGIGDVLRHVLEEYVEEDDFAEVLKALGYTKTELGLD